MKKETINQELSDAVQNLLQLARKLSFSKISDKCSFIISEIKASEKNAFEQTKNRKSINAKKIPKSFTEIVSEVADLYPNLYDVNLYIYKAKKNETIVEIQYFPRTFLDLNYQKITADQETMLHYKVSLPNYASNSDEKFDINWEHGTLNHLWKQFWWRLKTMRFLKKLN
jgi:hypothetical protein